MSPHHLDGWIPARIHWQPQGPAVEWRYLGGDRLLEPFFEVSMRCLLDRPFRALFARTTPIEVLEELAAGMPEPTGFIFHLSRCGSTLVTQMLAASPRNMVISEAGCVDDMIWAGTWGVRGDLLVRWVRSLIKVLCRPRAGESRGFVKFDPLQAVALPLIRMAFPATPWIFVYRDPVEILVSINRSRPAFATPGVAIGGFFPIPPEEAVSLDPDEYGARVLQRIASAAADRLEAGDGLAVNYTDLPAAVFSIIATHFSCAWEPSEVAAMEKSSRFHAKSPSSLFAPDSAAKQREASPELRGWAEQWLAGSYQRLEAARARWSAGRP